MSWREGVIRLWPLVYTASILLTLLRKASHTLTSTSSLKSNVASVKPYTRHTGSCAYRQIADHNACLCPKWLEICHGGKNLEHVALHTVSWDEAQRLAADMLRSMASGTASYRSRPRNLALYGVYVAVTCWSSMYVFANHTSHFLVPAAALLLLLLWPVGILVFGGGPHWVHRLLESKAVWMGLLCLLAAVNLLRYPAKAHGPDPNTAAPALIDTAAALVHGHDPYSVHLAGDAPVSPGPGWILLLAPLTLTGLVTLVMPLAAGVCAYLIGQQWARGAGLFVLLVFLQPDLIAMSFVAHDIFAIGIVFAILCILAERWSNDNRLLVVLGILAAAFATSRIPMIALVVILGIGLLRVRKQAGELFLAVSLLLTLLLHGVFFAWAASAHDYYQPLHIFSRASGGSGHSLELVGLAAALAVFAWVLTGMGPRCADWMAAAGLFLTAAFVPIGLGELLSGHLQFSMWEGSNYVSMGASLLAAAVIADKFRPVRNDDSGTR